MAAASSSRVGRSAPQMNPTVRNIVIATRLDAAYRLWIIAAASSAPSGARPGLNECPRGDDARPALLVYDEGAGPIKGLVATRPLTLVPKSASQSRAGHRRPHRRVEGVV